MYTTIMLIAHLQMAECWLPHKHWVSWGISEDCYRVLTSIGSHLIIYHYNARNITVMTADDI